MATSQKRTTKLKNPIPEAPRQETHWKGKKSSMSIPEQLDKKIRDLNQTIAVQDKGLKFLEKQVVNLENQLVEALTTPPTNLSPVKGTAEPLPELDTSHLKPQKGDSRVDDLVGQVLDLVRRISDNELLWPYRANAARTGAGGWTETPRALQNHIKETVLNLMKNPTWLRSQIYLRSCFLRTWAPMAMFRTLILVAGASALSDAAFQLHKERTP